MKGGNRAACVLERRPWWQAEAGLDVTGPEGVRSQEATEYSNENSKAEAKGLWSQTREWGGTDRRENCVRGWDHRNCGFAGHGDERWEEERHRGCPLLSLGSRRPGQEGMDSVSDESSVGEVSVCPCCWDRSYSLGASAAHTAVSQFCRPRPRPRCGTPESDEGCSPGSQAPSCWALAWCEGQGSSSWSLLIRAQLP